MVEDTTLQEEHSFWSLVNQFVAIELCISALKHQERWESEKEDRQ